MKKGLFVLVAVIVAVGLAAGSFYGGMAYQRTQTANIRAAFAASRGGPPNATDTAGGGGGRGGFFGGGARGQVKSIEGNVLTLSTSQNVTTVNLSNSTQIEKTGLIHRINDPVFIEERNRPASTIRAIPHAYQLIDDPCTTCRHPRRGADDPSLRYMT